MTNGSRSAAIIDTNSDGRWIVFDTYWFNAESDVWEASYSSGAGALGIGNGPTTAYIFGQAKPGSRVDVQYAGEVLNLVAGDSGWWLYVWDGKDWERMQDPRFQEYL